MQDYKETANLRFERTDVLGLEHAYLIIPTVRAQSWGLRLAEVQAFRLSGGVVVNLSAKSHAFEGTFAAVDAIAEDLRENI